MLRRTNLRAELIAAGVIVPRPGDEGSRSIADRNDAPCLRLDAAGVRVAARDLGGDGDQRFMQYEPLEAKASERRRKGT